MIWTWTTAFRATSARISVWSSMSFISFRSRTDKIDAAGSWASCGSTGPRTALGSMTISSAASATRVPPDIA